MIWSILFCPLPYHTVLCLGLFVPSCHPVTSSKVFLTSAHLLPFLVGWSEQHSWWKILPIHTDVTSCFFRLTPIIVNLSFVLRVVAHRICQGCFTVWERGSSNAPDEVLSAGTNCQITSTTYMRFLSFFSFIERALCAEPPRAGASKIRRTKRI